MRLSQVEFLIFFLLVLSISGCGLQKSTPPEPAQAGPAIPEVASEPSQKVPSEMVKEYANIHQISDLKTAEFRLTHPDYAKEHPYTPTDEDIAFYEREFLEKIYPNFKKIAEKEGFMKARYQYMNNPPAGSRSTPIGAAGYGALMDRLVSRDGEGASTGTTDAMTRTDTAAVHYQEAMRLYGGNHLDEAIEEMEKALQAKPDAPSILYNLGVMYMEKGNYAKSVPLMKSSVRYIKGTGYSRVNLATYSDVYMGALINLGQIYSQIGMYNEAVAVLKEAIQFRRDDADANRNLGITYYAMGDTDKASEQLRKSVELAPEDPALHNMIGRIYYGKKFYDAALDEFQKAVELNPDEEQYSYNLGLALAELGRHDEANLAFANAPGLEEGEEMRQVFAEQTAANRVRELYNEGHSALQSLNLTAAIELFEQVLELKPDMMEAHFNLGAAYRIRGNKLKQIHHFEEAVRLRPDAQDARYNLGLAYSDDRKYPQAISEFRAAIQLKPSFKDAHFNLGTALYKTENYIEAAAEFQRSLELSPGWFEAHVNLGTTYLKIEDVESATEQFEQAMRLRPESAEAHYNLGAAYMRVERHDEAAALFQKALELDPGYRPARLMLKELGK